MITSPEHVRREFDRLRLEERAASGELREVVRTVKSRIPTSEDARAVQEVAQWWSDEDTLVAIVHRWKDQAGNLVASGRNDPKWIGGDRWAFQAADVNRKRVWQHDDGRMSDLEFSPVVAGWEDNDSQPVWGMRCRNCGRLWIEVMSLANGSQFHTEAANIEELLRQTQA